MVKGFVRALAALALGAAASTSFAAPYSITFSDTTLPNPGVPPGIIGGSAASVTVVVDNGNATAANQTWDATTLQCVIFKFNGGSAYVAINQPVFSLSTTAGSIRPMVEGC